MTKIVRRTAVGVGIIALSWMFFFNGGLPQAQTSPLQSQLVDRGIVTTQLQGGAVRGEEVYMLLHTPEGWEFLLQGTLQAEDSHVRVTASLQLSPALQPTRYRMMRIGTQGERMELISMWGRPVGNQLVLGQQFWFLPGGGAPPESGFGPIVLEISEPWLITAADTFSFVALGPLLLLTQETEELRFLNVVPLAQAVSPRTLRRADPLQIVDNATGETRQADCLLWIRGSQVPPLEMLFRFKENGKSYAFWGLVVAGEGRAFAYRRDLFPQGFRVDRE